LLLPSQLEAALVSGRLLHFDTRRSVSPVMKIGAIAAQLGTTVRTLRFYEEQGLVQPRRTPGGTRVYDEADVARFAVILVLARLGFPLHELAALAAVRCTERPVRAVCDRCEVSRGVSDSQVLQLVWEAPARD
jgi:DNA-binding transcriptional MerR regulator